MIKWILQKIVGSKNAREVRRIHPTVERINEIEEALQREPDEKLREMTAGWQAHLARYHDLNTLTKPELTRAEPAILEETARAVETRLAALRDEFPGLPATVEPTVESIEAAKEAFRNLYDDFRQARVRYLDQILPEAYAVVKNAARRMCGSTIVVNGQEMTWDMVHFDVQLVGGIALHRGMIAEMQTGEGKTLVATLPVFLNALTGLGVHVVTVNDYLALRDSEWMGALFQWLGLTIGCIQNQMPPWDRKEQYDRDITYGTNSEFGFDYLRDNGMAGSRNDQVQRGHYFAIIDEVDSILIDEARTPLIISGPSTVSSHQFDTYKPQIEKLVKKQTLLCNKLITEAKQLLESDPTLAGRKLFKVKLGQPRNRQLMRLMQEPDARRLVDKTELSFYQDAQKKELFALKEELYFVIDEKANDADLMEKGREFLAPGDSQSFVLPDIATIMAEIDADESLNDEQRLIRKQQAQAQTDEQAEKMHNVSQLLKAYCVFEKDVQYVVEDGKIVIVDENTGRKMPGRRWSDGLHQAVEAKEGVVIEKETQTYATITIQNYFRLYEKLAGMTGTAETEAAEFSDIYKLDVLPIPTNRPNRRQDFNDQVFKTRREKYNAVIARITEAHSKGQPVLVGTASVEASETVARMLKRANIAHEVLNAKNHAREADIIAAAGQRNAVTISTNMAGRGTDIKLGDGVADLGGLFVIGTERYESRRVDRQLRGRCARQGDPGMSQFYISFEDDLMRNFAAADRLTAMMERFGMQDGEALEHKLLNRSVETAQKRVEERNYTWRKRVLDFDDVMNKQREVVYSYRNEVLTTEDPRDLVTETIQNNVTEHVQSLVGEVEGGEVDYSELLSWLNSTLPLRVTEEELQPLDSTAAVNDYLIGKITKAYELRVANLPPEILENEERRMILAAIDKQWQAHLFNMDSLREGISLRAQAQRDPLVEYKTEAFHVFVDLMDRIGQESLQNLFRSATRIQEFLRQQFAAMSENVSSEGEPNFVTTGSSGNLNPQIMAAGTGGLTLNLPKRKPSFEIEKVGRNAPCPCGSGKKYKHCCGRESAAAES